MKHYYLVAKDVGDLTRIFCASIEAENMRKPLIKLPRIGRSRELMGFSLDSDRLTTLDKNLFFNDPVAMIRLFYVGHKDRLVIHRYGESLVTENLRKIKTEVRENSEANRMFIEILTSANKPEIALTRMNESGVLGRFLPDFGRVVGQTQHDMYHVYTVDEHTIQAIGLLASIERGERRLEHPLATDLIKTISSRRALYVGVLFHDIAKGRGGNHSELGAEVARNVCPSLGLDEEETETVEWLVRYHLAFSNVAQKRDLSDGKTISDFAELVQSLERLKLLLCLTVVDMRATGPNVWNNWKAELLRELYKYTEDVLSGGQLTYAHKTRVETAKDMLRDRLKEWPISEIEMQLGRGYPGYWLTFDVESLVRHANLMRDAQEKELPLSIQTRVLKELDVTEVTVYVQDHPGLFSRLAAAFSAVSANVVDAKIFTTPEGMALDVFWLQDSNGRAFDKTDSIKKLRKQIQRSLAGEMGGEEPNTQRNYISSRTSVFKVAPRVIIDNLASATHTVIEINGRDRPGFLFSVTRALFSLSLQISSSKISTYGERAVDVFYVKDGFGMKVTHEERLEKIHEVLLEAIGQTDQQTGNSSHAA